MLDKLIQIDSNSPLSLQNQLKVSITDAIVNGYLDMNTPVTSSRKLASSLKVSRNTVLNVYDQLTEEGFFISQERKGHFINPNITINNFAISPNSKTKLNWNKYLKQQDGNKTHTSDKINESKYSFVHGRVDEAIFPVNEWRKCSLQVFNRANSQSWTASTYNFEALIEQIRKRVLPRRGIIANRENIAITLGCTNSLNILAKLLTDKKSTIGIENPGYPVAHEQLTLKKGAIKALQIDEKGLIVSSELDECNLIYTTPSNQFPTTVRMPSERRRKLLEKAKSTDSLIIEDDFEHEINHIDDSVPALKGEYPSDRIIYISSFSSSIAPGLRIGFMVGAPELIEQVKLHQTKTSTLPAQNNTQILATFIELGYYDALVQKLIKLNREKWLTMEKALNLYFPQSGVSPSLAGTAFWIKHNKNLNAIKLEYAAAQQNILINAGAQFFNQGDSLNIGNHCLRLSISSISQQNIREGIRKLSLIAKETAPQNEPPKGHELTGKEIRKILYNHTVLTSDCFNIPYTINFQKDGRMVGVSERAGDSDEGYWWIEAGKLCCQWKNWQFGEERRFTLHLSGTDLYRTDEKGYPVARSNIVPKQNV